MANYYGKVRTNYFHVTDEERYAELFAALHGAEDEVKDFSKEKDGRLIHGFGCYSSVSAYLDDELKPLKDFWEEDPPDRMDLWLDELAKILPDDECFVMQEVGSEKLRYLLGYSMIVTKKDGLVAMDLDNWTREKVTELLGSSANSDCCY